MTKYKLTLTDREYVYLKDAKGIPVSFTIPIKRTPIMFDMQEQVISYIEQLKCGRDFHLTTSFEIEEVEVI